jgi:MFS transporter, DHA1 family, inner membrane transport protein
VRTPRFPVALLSLAAAAFAIGTSEFVIMGLLPDVAADLAVSIPQAGLLVTGYAMGVVIGAPILAVLTAKFSPRPTLIGLAALFTVGNLLCALAPDYRLLMAARVLTALSHGTFFGVGSVVAANLVAPAQRSQAIALMFTGLTLANVLGVPAGRLIGHEFGWRTSFLAVVVIGLVAVAALMRLLPRRIAAQAGSIVREFVALKDPRVLTALLTSVLCSASLFCVFTFIAPILTEVSGFSASAIAPVLLVFGVGLTAGSTLGGRLGDRRLVPSIFSVLVLNGVVLAVMHWVSGTPSFMLAVLFVWGMLAFSLVPLLQTLIVHHAAAAPRLASTLNQGAFNLGNAVGAWSGSRLLSDGLPLNDLSWASVGFTVSALGLAAVGQLLFSRNRDGHAAGASSQRRLETQKV